ncbi:MAG: V-type ATP synthase subunit K [Candidatus Hodarchaeaceae archaeon]|nr:V-type ATP synthase subunit K [Candidatus Hodarchaeaceae archaeon]
MSGLAGEEVWVALAAGLAVVIPGIFSAVGVGMTGVAAAAVSAEDPKKFSKLFVLEVLPGTQGIYGFVAGFLIIFVAYPAVVAKIAIAPWMGMVVLVAAVPAILQGATAYSQGKVATAGVSAVAKRPEVFGQSMLYTVMVELYAILGLLATILILSSIGAMG